jgi:cytochrome c oxidase subunit 3
MLLGAFTSAYMVKKASGEWLIINMPSIFYFNSIVILLSSLTMHMSLVFARRNNIKALQAGLVITMILGVAFLAGQFVGWENLVAGNIYFVGNPSGSFVYVFTGVHGFHIVSGLVFLSIVLVSAFKYKIHSKNTLRIEMCATYWHFLDGLWLYLFIFLLLNN